MDTLTHGIVGAAVAQAGVGGRLGRKAMLIGLGAGMLPDADGLIRSSADPFLRIEYHRHFTHAFLFIPVGAAIAILPFLLSRWGRQHWRPLYAAALLAYLAHPPLDVATSYGTLVLWPFSQARIAVDWISVVDPLFTLPILLLVVWAAVADSRRIAAAAVGVGLCYLALGAVQESRARSVQADIAAARGHRIERGRVLPSLGNLIVWRSLYVADGKIHVDALRVAWPGERSYVPGDSVALAREPPLDGALPPAVQARLRREFARLWWFADGYVARSPQDPRVLGDMRYSVRTEAFEPLWGFRLQPEDPRQPVDWVRVAIRGRQDGFLEMWALVKGTSPKLSPDNSRKGS
jgi:inner membrane protein